MARPPSTLTGLSPLPPNQTRALKKALFPLLCLKNQYFAFYYLSTFFNSFASSNLVKNWVNALSFDLEENWWSCRGVSQDRGGDAGDVAAISQCVGKPSSTPFQRAHLGHNPSSRSASIVPSSL
ncbi:hypothetical protein C8Q78DRAFT_987238 [Trametes maxima]|nr:hypothetical protein C8Q78DRAFT_987238 [Trametes maxima]